MTCNRREQLYWCFQPLVRTLTLEGKILVVFVLVFKTISLSILYLDLYVCPSCLLFVDAISFVICEL